MTENKRLLKLDAENSSVAVVRLRAEDENKVRIKVSVIEKEYSSAPVVLFDGKNYYRVSDGDVIYNARLLSGVSCAVIYNGKILAKASYGGITIDEKGMLLYEKNYENGFKNENGEFSQNIYDDEKIAEENYYEKGGLNEKQTVYDVKTEKSYCGQKENRNETFKTFKDETDLSDEKHCLSHCADGGCDAFTEQDYQKEIFEFKRIVAGKERARDLENMIQGSVFYKTGETKFYYFGLIKNDGLPVYFCYAVPAKRKSPPEGFKKAFFLPKNHFDAQNGYYCIFQRAKEGKNS